MSTRHGSLRRLVPILVALAIVPTSAPVWSGTTGKLVGRVLDEKRQPLAGVNVRIEAARLGGITDESGNYFIIGIPGGIHTVKADLLGYAAFVAERVEIKPDFTTELDVRMRVEAVQLEEVRVEAQRPLLQKDATGTTRFISADEIANLPTRGYRDAAAQQTGVVSFQRNIDNESQNQPTLIIRGGRPNETAYFVDGFSQQDPLTGTSSTAISNNAIEEVVVMTGGFNPEYGRIMSGAVNVITREGQDHYFGALEGITDNLSGDWVGSGVSDYNVYDGSVGGPVIPGFNDLSFYMSGERRWQRDRGPSKAADVFRQQLATGASFGSDLVGRPGLDPDVKPANTASGYTLQTKLAWQPNDNMSLKVGGLGSQESWNEYVHAYLFNLNHSPRYEDRNQSYNATFNHVLSKRTFYTVGVNYFETLRKRGDGVAFDDIGGYYRPTNPRFDTDLPMFWKPGHVFDDYLQRRSSYVGVQTSLTSQMGPHHQLKFGGDFQRHTLRYFNHFFPVQLGGSSPNLTDWDGYGYRLVKKFNAAGEVVGYGIEESGDGDPDGPKHPKTFSLFAQDKFEREGVILNGGLRYDFINVDTEALLSERFPLGNPDDVGNLPDSLETSDLQGNKTYSRISPRFGVAFPVDERTVLRFNYGQFYQQPNLQDLYVSYRFLQHKVRTGGYFVGFGNPNLKPERTTAYEVGVARQFGDNVRVDLTTYYKDVKDLVEIATIPSFPNNFASYRNRDFATIKGLDIGFTMRPTNHIGTSVNYSLSFAQGTGSVSNSQRNIAWTADEPPKQTAPLDFDQRHKFSANIDWRLGKGEGPVWGNAFRPFENAGINVLFNVASGTPYTPTTVFNEVTLAAVATQPSGPLNSRNGPWTVNLDLKAERRLDVGRFGVEAYVWVLNVLDARNPVTVYSSSGSPATTNWLGTQDGQGYLQTASANDVDGELLYRIAENDPTLLSNPRLVRFGLRTTF